MKKTKILLTATIILSSTFSVKAQLGTWQDIPGGPLTFTSGQVGIGTNIPSGSLQIDKKYGDGNPIFPDLILNHDWYTGPPGMDPISQSIMEVWQSGNYVPCMLCMPTRYVHLPIFNISAANMGGTVAINKATASTTLDVGGSINADQDVTAGNNVNVGVDLIVNHNATVGNDLTVNDNAIINNNLYVKGGLIDMNMPSDNAWRNLNANSSLYGLNLTAGNGGASISMGAGYSGDRPGCISFITTGPLLAPAPASTGPTGYMFYWYGAADGAQPSWHDLVHIWNDGKVTIGENIDDWWENQYNLTPDGYKLFVSGGILTEKLKVALAGSSNWADFVFHNDYNLRSLNNVESYIKKNKHLPDVPSADEVVKSGIDVVAMDSKLLQKIEELTLYVIDQNKKLEMQQKQMEEQRKEINLLKKKMN